MKHSNEAETESQLILDSHPIETLAERFREVIASSPGVSVGEVMFALLSVVADLVLNISNEPGRREVVAHIDRTLPALMQRAMSEAAARDRGRHLN